MTNISSMWRTFSPQVLCYYRLIIKKQKGCVFRVCGFVQDKTQSWELVDNLNCFLSVQLICFKNCHYILSMVVSGILTKWPNNLLLWMIILRCQCNDTWLQLLCVRVNAWSSSGAAHLGAHETETERGAEERKCQLNITRRRPSQKTKSDGEIIQK